MRFPFTVYALVVLDGFLLHSHPVTALSTPQPYVGSSSTLFSEEATTRRSFVASLFVVPSVGLLLPQPVQAYEERPVGGADRSPATAAMNLQAIETNNRLEQQGVKLDSQADQIKSLSAELSSYSYEPTTSKKGSKDKNAKSK